MQPWVGTRSSSLRRWPYRVQATVSGTCWSATQTRVRMAAGPSWPGSVSGSRAERPRDEPCGDPDTTPPPRYRDGGRSPPAAAPRTISGSASRWAPASAFSVSRRWRTHTVGDGHQSERRAVDPGPGRSPARYRQRLVLARITIRRATSVITRAAVITLRDVPPPRRRCLPPEVPVILVEAPAPAAARQHSPGPSWRRLHRCGLHLTRGSSTPPAISNSPN